VVVRLAADQSDAVAVGVGEHGDAADRCVDRGQDTGAPELLGAGEGAVHVIDREVDDEPGIRTVRAGLADPACRLAAVVAGQRVGLVEDIDRPAEQVLVEASCSRGVGSGDVEPRRAAGRCT